MLGVLFFNKILVFDSDSWAIKYLPEEEVKEDVNHLQAFDFKKASKKRDIGAEYSALQNDSDSEEEKQEHVRGKFHQT